MSKISVLIKEPGQTPRHVCVSNTLENLQKTVGGYIEAVTLRSDLVLICDEEGRMKGKPWSCKISGMDFVGTVILCGVGNEEFADMPIDWKDMKRVFPQLWEA